MFRHWFLDHPHSVGESYRQHQRVALGVGVQLLAGGAACLVHALIPCLFQHTASSVVTKVHQRMDTRLREDRLSKHLELTRLS